MKYKVKVDINGKKYDYIIESPVELSSTEAKQQARQELSDPQRLRSFLQGTTLGFADEIEAGAKSAFGGMDYGQEVGNVRAKMAQYREDEPLSSTMYEIAGAIPPTLLAARGGPATAAVPATRLGMLASKALPLAAESAVSAYGFSEADNLSDQARDVGIGTLAGTMGGGIMGLAAQGLGMLGNKFMSFVREKMGDKANDAVQAELQRLVELTGKSTDEILVDVAEGKPISDNQTLVIALKNYVNQGGKPARDILEQTKAMAQQRRAEGQSALEGGLVGGQSGNQLQRGQQDISELKAQERDAYQQAFNRSGEPSPELVGQMVSVLQRFPQAGAELDEIYTARNLVPLFKKDEAGAIQIVRQPTAEDAEILYRSVRDFTGQAFQGGRGTMGETAGQVADELKERIGQDFPNVARARQVSAGRFAAQEAFESGRKALTKDPEELDIMIQNMSESQIKAFRAGLMNAINRRMQTGTTFRDLADENKNIGKVLRLALRPEDVDSIVKQMGRTAESVDIAQKMPSTAGSPTAPLQQEARRSGSAENVMQTVDALSGSPYAMMQVLSNLTQKQAQGLTEQQRQQVVNVLISEDPQLVMRALTDDTAMAALEKKIKDISGTISKSAQRATQQQSTQIGVQN